MKMLTHSFCMVLFSFFNLGLALPVRADWNCTVEFSPLGEWGPVALRSKTFTMSEADLTQGKIFSQKISIPSHVNFRTPGVVELTVGLGQWGWGHLEPSFASKDLYLLAAYQSRYPRFALGQISAVTPVTSDKIFSSTYIRGGIGPQTAMLSLECLHAQ